ncbi:MAG TPA: carbamoyltransferase HypF [Solirubrobacteraceae bacterium]
MSAAATRGLPVRTRVRVQGTVQGVGYRPFVFRIAGEEGLAGYVLNDEHGVLVEVEGAASAVRRFVERLRDDAPPLAAVDRVTCEPMAPAGEPGFRILASERAGAPDALVTPDTATCADCLAELLDPNDRRHRYPFINCTNCGPRFTIVRGVPYDRPLTTMAGFRMCAECRREYEDPRDRRFHAQPNACPRCGPTVAALDAGGSPVSTGAVDTIGWVASRLAQGAIAAVKGIGGFHLVCDAADESAVSALRSRKHREARPFALMVGDMEAARGLVSYGAGDERLLCGIRRPIVLALRVPDAPVAPSVAPAAPELGVMLPYTPLHHLLTRDFAAILRARHPGHPAALVMTSGNVSDEPIAFRDADALDRLRAIADLFLLHDREIETRTDDSVIRTVPIAGPHSDGEVQATRPLLLRRSRGYVPGHLELPVAAARPLLACGAQQKNTFCVAKGSRAWVSHHIGDLDHYATLAAFREGIAHFERLFAVSPQVVAHDQHPDYLATSYALDRPDVEHVAVQHHHAHLAACLAEHGVGAETRAVAAIFDGTGYGSDGTVWGGELLVGGLTGFVRAGWLRPLRMPGAAAAIRQPWRMAAAWLAEAYGEPRALPAALVGRVDPGRWAAMTQVAASASVSPLTSSMGRLFDAVAAMCGLGAEVSYEGQAAVELEAAAWTAPRHVGEYWFDRQGPVLDPRPAVRQASIELERGVSPDLIAARFHAGLARVTVALSTELAQSHNVEIAVLSGGVFQNRLLLETVGRGLHRAGLRVMIPERLPPNDGGISFGQAAVAAAISA